MKKIVMLGASALLFSSTAYAGTISGTLQDPDFSADTMSYSGSVSDNQGEDAAKTITAQFTLSGSVDRVCAVNGVDAGQIGLNGTVNLGTIGINAGDDTSLSSLFTMTGPAVVDIQSAAAGCNYENTVSLAKSNGTNGLTNVAPGGYDTTQFQANIPYGATARFTGVATGVVGAGTAQFLGANKTTASATGNFGAWRSPLDIHVEIPQVTGKGLVGGDYSDVLTLTLATS